MDTSALDALLRAEQNEEYERGLEEVSGDTCRGVPCLGYERSSLAVQCDIIWRLV